MDKLSLFFSFRFCQPCCKLKYVGHFLCRNQHHDAIHSSINLERYSVLRANYSRSSNTKISDCLGINLKTFIFILMNTKNLVYILFLRVATRDGDVMLSFIFPHSLTLNMEVYIKCLEEIMLIWIERLAAGRPYV